MATDLASRSARSTGLVDVLDRVLDKGLVIAGDIRVSLAEVELLTIRIRLIVCSLDKAQAIGLDWWKHDRYLSPGNASDIHQENETLRAEVARLSAQLTALAPPADVRVSSRRNGSGAHPGAPPPGPGAHPGAPPPVGAPRTAHLSPAPASKPSSRSRRKKKTT